MRKFFSSREDRVSVPMDPEASCNCHGWTADDVNEMFPYAVTFNRDHRYLGRRKADRYGYARLNDDGSVNILIQWPASFSRGAYVDGEEGPRIESHRAHTSDVEPGAVTLTAADRSYYSDTERLANGAWHEFSRWNLKPEDTGSDNGED